MYSVTDELDRFRRTLNAAGIEYALCGGLAMAMHGHTRGTEDIDLLVLEEDLPRIEELAADHGFTLKALPMNFDNGAMKIRRISKIDPSDGEVLMLDFLLVTPASQHVWDTRESRDWRGEPLTFVSAEGLISLKQGRMSLQDQADIARLRGEE
jgi:hypothetical protein